MSILDRKPAKYSTSDLFWEPSAAPSDGTVGDINTMRLDPSHLGMAQDVIIDSSGILRNRGAFNTVTSDTFAHTIVGITQCGANTVATSMAQGGNASFLYGSSVAALTGFAKLTVASLSATTAGTNPNAMNQNTPLISNFSKLVNDSGAVICNQSTGPQTPYTASTYVWGGNSVTTSDTTAGTAASTQGSKSIAGVGTAWTTALIGCYLYIGAGAAATLVGRVNQVTSTTTILLEKGAYKTVAAAAPAFKTARPVMYFIYKGRITTSTSTTSVIGANTKFNTSGPGGSGGTFISSKAPALFRYSDGTFVGTVSSVQNDTTMTLTGNAAIAMTNEEYYLISPDQLINVLPTNYFYANAVEQFANRYWYGGFAASDTVIAANGQAASVVPYLAVNNQSSIAFSKKGDPESLDLDPSSGDIITLPFSSTDSIRGMIALSGGLIVFRTLDTFLITGYSPETFRAIKILDDGIQGCLAYKPYKSGVLFAGTKSIWYFDGTRMVDLLQNKLRGFYRRSAKPPPNTQAIGTAVSNDHFMISYLFNDLDQTWPYKNTTKNSIIITMVINMLNGAISFFTNIFVTTSFYPNPISSTIPGGTPVIVARNNAGVNDSGGTSYLLNGTTVFVDSATAANNFDSVTGAATFTSQVSTQIGPDVQFETVKLSLGNAARLKFWKMVLFNYSSAVSMTAMFVATNDTTLDFPNRSTGTAGVVTLPVSSNVGILKRIKFLIRSPQLSIRVYQTATTSATSQRFKLFWYTVGGKWMRQGRQQ